MPVSPSVRAVKPLVGGSAMPASRPLCGRLRNSTAPSPRRAMKAAPRRRGFSFFAGRTG
jgi:hypothetical protein